MYETDFFADRDRQTRYSAEQILTIIKRALPSVRTAVDVGCGVGTWLSVLQTMGAETVMGIDGPWVPRDKLVIPESSFRVADLNADFASSEHFDLAISLEVAEHLRPESADRFVRNLVALSDVVFFSAALPFQGGNQHLNEQWPDYWMRRFATHGYVPLDLVRKRLWADERIPVWYRQNSLLYVRENAVDRLSLRTLVEDHLAPERYLLYFPKLTAPGVRQSSESLWRAVIRRLSSYA